MTTLLKMIMRKSIVAILWQYSLKRLFRYYHRESSNALKSSDVLWYWNTFGIMHRYTGTLYCLISTVHITYMYYNIAHNYIRMYVASKYL